MRTINLAPGLISSVLGFGCGPILGSVGGRQAELALEIALELGVTHLDVAPSYGYGQAENWLGKRLKGRRDKVIVATKFGIEPRTIAKILAPAKSSVRLFKSLKKGKELFNKYSAESKKAPLGKLFYRAEMTGVNLQKSAERSLRALKTDRIDLLLLHEPPSEMPHWSELRSKAEQLKKAGKIRAFGIAYYRNKQVPSEQHLKECDVRQFDCSPNQKDYETLVSHEGYKPSVLFSPFSGLSAKSKHEEVLRKIVTDFPKSVILCGMFSESHIRKNAVVVNSVNI